jgi:hypothetical protein
MRWIVEMTISSRVKPVAVQALDSESAKDAAEAKHPEAERIWGAYTLKEWIKIKALTRKAKGES